MHFVLAGDKMKTFACWCKTKDGSSQVEFGQAETHFNLWVEYNSKDTIPCLDVGLMLPSQNISELYFYVPFSVSDDEVTDLGNIISTDPTLLKAIFNDELIIQQGKEPKQIIVAKTDTRRFIIYSLSQNNIKIKQGLGGTVIKLIIPQDNKEERIYLRFRIKSKGLNSLIQQIKPKNAMFTSAVSTDFFIDFRYNDIRSFEPDLREMIRQSQYTVLQWEKIHFFLMTNPQNSISSLSVLDERQLEPCLWDKYFEEEHNKFLVAYHWKQKKGSDTGNFIKNCNIYLRFRESTCNWKTITIYLIIFLAITIIANAISADFINWLGWLWSQIK